MTKVKGAKKALTKSEKILKKLTPLKQRNLYHVKFQREQLLPDHHKAMEQALVVASKKREVRILMLMKHPNMSYCRVIRVNLKNKGFIKEFELRSSQVDTITT